MSKAMIEAGTVGDKQVWIGAPASHYEEAVHAMSGEKVHVLRFTLNEADAVCRMLRTEIRRVRRRQARKA